METPLTPLEVARRTRRLHPQREALADGGQRFSYEQLFDRCDRWSSALQRLGVRAGDRVVYIAPNTHALLEGFYAVPQLGAVMVPLNYRLTPADFAYMINHCGARVVCAHSDYLEAVVAERWPAGKRKQVAGEVRPRYLPLFQYLEIQRAKIAAMLLATLLHQAPAQRFMGACGRNSDADPKGVLRVPHYLDRR